MCSARPTDATSEDKQADAGALPAPAAGALSHRSSAAGLGTPRAATPRDATEPADDDPGANPRPAWGENHLMTVADATASARFAGGGRDMPTVLSAGPPVARGGRGRWDVRFDKKGAGVTKVGLIRVNDAPPEDRRGVGVRLGQVPSLPP